MDKEPLADGKNNQGNEENEKIFVLGHHSRSSSTSSTSSLSDDEFTEVRPKKQLQELKQCRRRISGSCLCKITVLVYLAGCILVSALYVAIYGSKQQQLQFGNEAWIPGKPTVHEEAPIDVRFYDNVYTEWISQRWTYHNATFADWPSLPPTVSNIQQITHGLLNHQHGIWLLTESELFFVENLGESDDVSVEFQNVSATMELDVTPGSRVVLDIGGQVYLVSPINVTLLDCYSYFEDYCEIVASNVEPLEIGEVHSAVLSVSTNTLWIGSTEGLYTATIVDEDEIVIQNVSEVIDEVLTLAWRSSITVDSSGSKEAGSFFMEPGVTNQQQKSYCSTNEHSIRCDNDYIFNKRFQPGNFGLLVVGTKDRLYFFDGKVWWFEWVSIWHYGLGGAIDGVPTSMVFAPSGELFISNNVSLTRVNVNYTFDRIGPLQGLPYNQLLSLHHMDYNIVLPKATQPPKAQSVFDQLGTLWIGTSKGYTLFDVASSRFQGYYYGPRWHSGEVIKAVTSGGGNTVVLLTDKGLTVVHPEMWTLKKKANHYLDMLQRHTRPPGLVADCPLTNFTPSTCAPYTTDNDGLWTSWLVASEAFRYQVTKDTDAQDNSWALFRGLQFLVNVTGIHGLMARSVVDENVTVDGETWHDSNSVPGWKWKGDTSSDEVVGHMFAYPIVYDLVAMEDEDMKEELEDLIDNVVGYIRSNNYTLVDVTNQTTRWGVWSPTQLNLNQSWADEHGINSLQILSYLLSAYRITGKVEYLDDWKELFSGSFEDVPTHYGLNMINQKITFPRDDNFSDNELSFLPYFVYFHTIKNMKPQTISPQLTYYANLSLERSWKVVKGEKSSAWTVIYAYATGRIDDVELIEQLVWNLRTWPLELIEWPSYNSHRLDIRINPEQDRDFRSGTQSVAVLPANERTQLRWNANPYRLDSDGSNSEMDPGVWLMPYWFARWINML